MLSYVAFPGVILKKNGDTWLFGEKVEKNVVLVFFHVLIQETLHNFTVIDS